MEFEDYKDWGADADSDEEEEALSFCDLPLGLPSAWESPLRDSNAGSTDFDFEFGRFSSVAYSVCPADDLFHQGRLLPVSLHRSRSSDCGSQFSNSRCENRLLLNEKLQSWRTDSLDSQSSYWTSSSSGNSQTSQRSERIFRRGNTAADSCKSKPNKSSKPPPLPGKTALKWQQIFTLGLMKTPSMKLEDIRLRQQQKPVEKSVLKRSVSCGYDDGAPIFVQKKPAALKCKSVRENMSAEEAPKFRGWGLLVPLTSLNGCKASTNSVINCSISKKRGDGEPFAGPIKLKSASKKPPLYEDQNLPNSARGFRKHSGDNRAARNSTVDPRKLSFS